MNIRLLVASLALVILVKVGFACPPGKERKECYEKIAKTYNEELLLKDLKVLLSQYADHVSFVEQELAVIESPASPCENTIARRVLASNSATIYRMMASLDTLKLSSMALFASHVSFQSFGGLEVILQSPEILDKFLPSDRGVKGEMKTSGAKKVRPNKAEYRVGGSFVRISGQDFDSVKSTVDRMGKLLINIRNIDATEPEVSERSEESAEEGQFAFPNLKGRLEREGISHVSFARLIDTVAKSRTVQERTLFLLKSRLGFAKRLAIAINESKVHFTKNGVNVNMYRRVTWDSLEKVLLFDQNRMLLAYDHELIFLGMFVPHYCWPYIHFDDIADLKPPFTDAKEESFFMTKEKGFAEKYFSTHKLFIGLVCVSVIALILLVVLSSLLIYKSSKTHRYKPLSKKYVEPGIQDN